jgi:hypothetical protein
MVGKIFLALVYRSSGLKSHNFTNLFPWWASSPGLFPDRIQVVLPPHKFFPLLTVICQFYYWYSQLLIIKNSTTHSVLNLVSVKGCECLNDPSQPEPGLPGGPCMSTFRF